MTFEQWKVQVKSLISLLPPIPTRSEIHRKSIVTLFRPKVIESLFVVFWTCFFENVFVGMVGPLSRDSRDFREQRL